MLKISETIYCDQMKSPVLIPSSTHTKIQVPKRPSKNETFYSLLGVDLEGKPSFRPAEVKSKHETKSEILAPHSWNSWRTS